MDQNDTPSVVGTQLLAAREPLRESVVVENRSNATVYVRADGTIESESSPIVVERRGDHVVVSNASR